MDSSPICFCPSAAEKAELDLTAASSWPLMSTSYVQLPSGVAPCPDLTSSLIYTDTCRYGDLNQITKDDYVDADKAARDPSKHGPSPTVSVDSAIAIGLL